MLLSDLVRGLIVGAIALLAFANALQIWHLYVMSIVFGTVDAFFQPAYVALLPEVTPGPALPSANSLTSLSGQLAGIIGPAIGAGIVAVGGTSVAFAFDALSFFISAACLMPLRHLPKPAIVRMGESGAVRDLREGFHTVLASPWLWVTIGLAAIANFTIAGPLAVATPFLVKDDLHADVGILGLVYSISSIGSVLGALWSGSQKRLHHRGVIAYTCWIIASLGVTIYGLPHLLNVPAQVGLAVILIAGGVFGASIAILNLIWAHTLQEMVPREQLGRVSSIDQLGSFALIPVGTAVAGWATGLIGASQLFLIGGLLSAALAVLGLMLPAIRKVD